MLISFCCVDVGLVVVVTIIDCVSRVADTVDVASVDVLFLVFVHIFCC